MLVIDLTSGLREQLGKAFTAIMRFLIAHVSDATCGLKAFRGNVGRDLFSRIRVHDWSFDAEVLCMARVFDHSIEEVPVRWEDRAESKAHLMRDAFNSLVGIIRSRVNSALGRYLEPVAIAPVSEIWSSDGADPDSRAD